MSCSYTIYNVNLTFLITREMFMMYMSMAAISNHDKKNKKRKQKNKAHWLPLKLDIP